MSRRPNILSEQEAHTTRIAWWAAFLITVAAVAILGLVRSAQAATLPVGNGPAAAALSIEAPEGEDEESESEECEGEDGDCAAAAREMEAATPSECMLKSAAATVTALSNRNTVRFTLRYTTFSPAIVSVGYSLRGGRGGLRMGEDSERFSRDGVFRDTEALSAGEMARVRAASEFDVRIHAVNTPRYCHRFLDSRLSARHAAHGGLTWTSRPARPERP